jgi:transposase
MPAAIRDPDRERFWRTTIAGQASSGQSIRAYGASRGISRASYFYWKRSLDARSKSSSAPAFAAVRVVADPVLEIVLPTGLVVRVPVGPDPAAVARLVAALGGSSC